MTGEELRRRALEAFNAHHPVLAGHASPEEIQTFLHELGVHQIELEMQNEELHRTQAELAASRQRYFELFDLAPVGYLTLAADGTVLETNHTAAGLLGLDPVELVGRHLGHFVAPEHRDREYLARNHLLAVGQPEKLELLLAPRDRPTFWARLVGNRVESEGRFLCRVALADITDLKQAEGALNREKELLSLTLDAIGDGVMTLDAGALVRTLNPAAEVLTGWPQAQAAGQPLGTVFPVAGVGTPSFLRIPSPLVSLAGEKRLVTGSVSPICSPQGELLGTVLVFRDVSGRLKLSEALQRNDKLDSLGILAGGIAHDFNNLLGGIFGYLNLARDVGHPDPVTLKYLEKALAVFHRAKALTLQLLTFSSGGAPLRTRGRLGDLILKTAEFALAGSNVSLDILLPEDLWSCEFDEHQIEQVLDNLVINARQAMPDGGIIHIAARNVTLGAGERLSLAAGPYLAVSVTDQGEGVALAVRDKIFDPFFTTKAGGHGLGLATCYSIIMKHGGVLEFAPQEPQGAIFRFFLPALESGESGVCQDEDTEHHGSGSVLILDDEAYLREVLGAQLRALGYRVVEAAEGSAALELARSCPDLRAAILDLTVKGGLGGRETLALLREERPLLPVIASSGYSEDPVMASPGEYGFTASLAKPYQPADLTRLLAKVLKASSGTP